MPQFYLVRHGEPNWPWAIERRFFGPGSTYIPLTENGVAQLEESALSPLLRGAEYIVASPYTRTMQSAQILSRRLDLEVKVDWRLHEWLYDTNMRGDLPAQGEYYGMEDMSRSFQHYIIERGEPLPDHACETIGMIRSRALEALCEHRNAAKVIVVCHEGVIRSLTGAAKVDFGEIVPFDLPAGC